MKTSVLAAAFLASSTAWAVAPLGVPYEQQAQDASRKIVDENKPNAETEIRNFVQKYKAKCVRPAREAGEYQLEYKCFLEECDAQPAPCRTGRILLFRGGFLSPDDSRSGGLRSRRRGSTFAADKDLYGMTRELVRAAAQLPNAPVYDPVKRSLWFWKSPDGKYVWAVPVKPPENLLVVNADPDETPSGTPLERLSILHKGSTPFFYREAPKSALDMDPFVSYSYSPIASLSFVSKGHHLTVLSVPKDEITHECSGEGPRPGAYWDANKCHPGATPNYEYEREVYLVHYPLPDHVFGSFTVTQELADELTAIDMN